MNGDFPELPNMTRPQELRWRVLQLDADEDIQCHIAGPVRRVMTHFIKGRTVPCCALMTQSQVVCSCETEPSPIRVTGYLPVELRDRSRVVIMLAATVAAQVQGWPHGTPIKVVRSSRVKRPLALTRLAADAISASQRRIITDGPEADIRPFLLHLWQNKALCQHFGVEFLPSEASQIAAGHNAA